MAESDRRHRYAYNRVLIETERILDPQFDDAVVFLSGAQLELLRNMTQYLNRRDTYVSEQFLDYYLAPTVADYDEILAIVADMEESLMGNPNTIWGYKELYRDVNNWNNASVGDKELDTDVVPAGSVVHIEAIAWMNDTSIMGSVLVSYKHDGEHIPLAQVVNPAAGAWHIYAVDRTLAEGERIKFWMYGVVAGDNLWWQAVGTVMDVPE